MTFHPPKSFERGLGVFVFRALQNNNVTFSWAHPGSACITLLRIRPGRHRVDRRIGDAHDARGRLDADRLCVKCRTRSGRDPVPAMSPRCRIDEVVGPSPGLFKALFLPAGSLVGTLQSVTQCIYELPMVSLRFPETYLRPVIVRVLERILWSKSFALLHLTRCVIGNTKIFVHKPFVLGKRPTHSNQV